MPTYMDYMISPYPIRTFDSKVDKSRLKVKSLAIVGAGHLPGRTLQRADAAFEHWAFVYIAGGRGYYQVDDGPRQPVGAGSLFCFFPGAVFQYGPETGADWDEYYFTVEGARIREWTANWFPQPSQVRRAQTDESVRGKLERIFMLMESGSPVHLDQAALQLESVLYELAVQASPAESGGRKRIVAAVIDDLTSALYEPLDARRTAERHHIAVSTLRRIVEAYTGYPLNEFVHRLKTSEAKRLLLNTDRPVKEIAEMLGYKDMFYFSRVFKRIAGLSPRTYRSQNGQ
ncbi:helix-turn-helix transcriptional regulator [Paenibacillus humicola]|uniref:helix-turn-helix transcriptional regulator n=1 Tax=Paenibacillus humicola TaxID=3110540 RepID=UPI00237B4BFD|nr:AraC family transcriptional regulator [Paenibacillus humicola]